MTEPTPERAQPQDLCDNCGKMFQSHRFGRFCYPDSDAADVRSYFKPHPVASPLSESGATEGNTEAADLAREIVTRIVTNAITSIYVRNLDQGDELPTEEESVADGLAIALGDEIGCLSEDDEDFRERIDVLWLEDKLAASLKPEPTGAQGRADKAVDLNMSLVDFMDEVCERLPVGWELDVEMEQGAGDFSLYHPNGMLITLGHYGSPDDHFVKQGLDAISYAIRTAAASLAPSEPVSPQPRQFETPADELAQRVIDEHPGTSMSAAYRAVAIDLYYTINPRRSESPLPVQDPQECNATHPDNCDTYCGREAGHTGQHRSPCQVNDPLGREYIEWSAPELPVRPQEEFEEWWQRRPETNFGWTKRVAYDAWRAGQAAILKPSEAPEREEK